MLAYLIRRFGDIDLAEECLQEAYAAALVAWAADGVPTRPGAWISVAARRKATDRLRREQVRSRRHEAFSRQAETYSEDDSDAQADQEEAVEHELPDERLRLLFTCCHPALALEAQVALTLRTLGGLTTAEIAAAFLRPEATLAQRIVRAKKKIRVAGIPYRVPGPDLLPERLPGVLAVLYLIFNEGYAASAGDSLVRRELCAESIRLARVLAQLLPDAPEVLGLLALMLLSDSRRDARTATDGAPVLLEDQDRSRWDRAAILEGTALVRHALSMGAPGAYQIQAAIAALHAESPGAAGTDWPQIAALYDELLQRSGGPVVALNRAVAVAMAWGPERGLALIEPLAGELDSYLYFHSARADLLRRLGRFAPAAAAYRRALERGGNAGDRLFLERRLREVETGVAREGRPI